MELKVFSAGWKARAKLPLPAPSPLPDAMWRILNRERGRLIDCSLAGVLSPVQEKELAALQAYADVHLETTRARAEVGDSVTQKEKP